MYRLWRDKTLHQIWTKSINPQRSYCDFNIWPDDLEHVLSVALGSGIIFTKFDLRQLFRAWIIAFLCWYAMSRCDLDFWPLHIELSRHFDYHVFKLSIKFEQNRILHDWVVGDLARLRRAILGGRAFLPNGSQGCVNPSSPNLART